MPKAILSGNAYHDEVEYSDRDTLLAYACKVSEKIDACLDVYNSNGRLLGIATPKGEYAPSSLSI